MVTKPKRRRPAVNLTLNPVTLSAAKALSFSRGESLSVLVERGILRLLSEQRSKSKASPRAAARNSTARVGA